MKKYIVMYLIVGILAIAILSSGCSLYNKEGAIKDNEKVDNINYDSKELINEISGLISTYEEKRLEDIHNMVKDKSAQEIQVLRIENKFTYEELTATYLYKIKTKDQDINGTNSFVSINPKVMEQAKELDNNYSKDMVNTYPLYGMSIGVKDNINTKDMATTAGSYALRENRPSEDSIAIKNLTDNKALVIGKTNLSEFAGYMSKSAPDGYSSIKGQTHHGKVQGQSPSGSSAGSAAAVAANYCTAAIGSDTSGSIIYPAEVHSLVGIKPTHGSVSAIGVVPLVAFMDTLGSITRNLEDGVALIEAMGHEGIRKTILLEGDKSEKRIGILKSDEKKESFEAIRKNLESLGYTVVDVEIIESEDKIIDLDTTLEMAFQKDLDQYLLKYNAPYKSLKDIVWYNKSNPKRAMLFGQDNLEGAIKGKYNEDRLKASVENARMAINKVIKDNKVQAIVFLGANEIGTSSTAGYPIVTIPTSFTKEKKGLSIIGGADSEALLVSIGLRILNNKK